MDLSVLIVSYNTRAKTLACLRSIEQETCDLDYEVRILDNASVDGSAAAIRAEFPELELDVQRENLGFARGVNRLARSARGEFLLLLNPDSEILDGAIQRLVSFARSLPGPGVFGGRTVRPDGGPDFGFAWKRATLWSTLCNAAGLAGVFPRSAVFNPEGVGGRLGDGEHLVDIVSGCFFLVQRSLWSELGGFNPAFFVYGEEADFCLRAGALGIHPMVTSRAVIVHHGGASEPSLAEKQVKLLAARNRLMQLHWPRGRARVGAWILGLHALLRVCAFSMLTWPSPKRFGARAREWRSVWGRRGQWLSLEVPRARTSEEEDEVAPSDARQACHPATSAPEQVPTPEGDAGSPPARKRILAISSGGGHWLQLGRIRSCFDGHDITYATVHPSARAEVSGARFYLLRDASRWNKLGLIVLAAQTLRIVFRERPDVIVTTGAAPGLLGVFFGKLFGARTMWLDSIANAQKLSLSGRLAGRFTDLWLTQWPHLESSKGPHFRGTVV